MCFPVMKTVDQVRYYTTILTVFYDITIVLNIFFSNFVRSFQITFHLIKRWNFHFQRKRVPHSRSVLKPGISLLTGLGIDKHYKACYLY